MPSTPPLWSGREAEQHDPDHEWLSTPAPTRVRPRPQPEPAPDPGVERSATRRARRAAIAAVIVAVLALGVAAVSLLQGDDSQQRAVAPLPPATGGRVADSRVNQIYARVQDGVVQVRAGSGSGTGFVIDADGTIVTNAHVVGSASQVQVRFDDERPRRAGRRPAAPTRRRTSPSSTSTRARSTSSTPLAARRLRRGQGRRPGHRHRLPARPRPHGDRRDRLRPRARDPGAQRLQHRQGHPDRRADQPGQLGRPAARRQGARDRRQLADRDRGRAGGNVGIGFAVPSNTVREVVPQLAARPVVERPYLGVSRPARAPTGGPGASGRRGHRRAAPPRRRLRPRAAQRRGGDVIVTGSPARRSRARTTWRTRSRRTQPGDRIEVEVDARRRAQTLDDHARRRGRRTP